MQKAILIIGPTGSGKTPLGEHLKANGLNGHQCHHFDFGANLRRVSAAGSCTGLSDSDIQVVDDVLNRGALLEDDTFHIAKTILQAFLEDRGVAPDDLLVLNGLPRHAGQAEAMADMIAMELLICLDCSPEVVRQRIRLNSGGDRTSRSDDSPDAVEMKLQVFAARTATLVEHYRSSGISSIHVNVDIGTTPEAILDIVQQITDEICGLPSQQTGMLRGISHPSPGG